MADYFLPAHVHFCCRGDDFVFLDLKQDDYTLVNGRAAQALRAISEAASQNTSPSESAEALKELLEGGLLIDDCRQGKLIRATQTERALESLLDTEDLPKVRMTLSHVYHFIAACTTAAARLRWGKIEQTVRSVERRKQLHSQSASFDIDKARELTATFQAMRALFPRDYLCLFDSLALLEFLARHGVFPTWVFGVRLEPWGAHCWVQQGSCIFNEDVETAAGYSPIMAI